MLTKFFLATFLAVFFSFATTKDRIMIYNNQEVKTTFDVDERFIGRYEGEKGGYLLLNADGTGEYKYDYFGFAMDHCEEGFIKLEWGFVYDHGGKVLYFDRQYGLSYPVIYKAVGKNSFKGCAEQMLLDYILIYDDSGVISVSSSSDWEKK